MPCPPALHWVGGQVGPGFKNLASGGLFKSPLDGTFNNPATSEQICLGFTLIARGGCYYTRQQKIAIVPNCANGMETIIPLKLRHLWYSRMPWFQAKHTLPINKVHATDRKPQNVDSKSRLSVLFSNKLEIAVCAGPPQIIWFAFCCSLVHNRSCMKTRPNRSPLALHIYYR